MRVTQAMLLAAGFSTRLRPLTDEIPKPLLPFWNRTILDFILAYLETSGIKSVAVNVHHGREKFLEALEKPRRIDVRPFVEEVILDTGAGIRNMQSFVTEDTFVVLNSDFITDVRLKDAVRFHVERNALATMVLISGADPKRYNPIGVDEEGRIVAFPYGEASGKPKKNGIFSGIHVFNHAIFREMPGRKIFGINRDVYPALLKKGAPVFGYVTKSMWWDLGELDLYAKGQFELLKHRPKWVDQFLKAFAKTSRAVFIAKDAKIDAGAKIHGPALISERVVLERGASIGPNIILGAEVHVGEESRIKNSIVYSKAMVPAGTSMNGQIGTSEEGCKVFIEEGRLS